MGFFDGKKIKELSEHVKALQQRNNFNSLAENIKGQVAQYPDYKIIDNSGRYATTDDIYSIVNMLSKTAALIPLRGYTITDEKKAKELRRITRPEKMPLQAKALMIKALEDLQDNDELNTLLENPSPNYGKFEFYEGVYVNLFLFGECIILKERPELGVNAGKPISMLILSPVHVVLNVSESLPRSIVSYSYVINGKMVFENIPPEDIIHIKYYNPEVSYSGNELRGLSTIKVLSRRLTQLDSNSNVQTAQMQNGGINTIVFDKAPNDQAAVEINGSRKDNFYRFLKNPNNAGAPFFASGEMASIHIGSTLADMKVIESSNINFKKLCNAFGTSDVLFNNGESSTESNVQVMTARTYTNTVLPNVYRVRDAFVKGLLPDFKDQKYEIREDISEITELQPNSKQMAEWLAIAWWVSPNDKLEMMRFERNDNPIMDQPLIPSGLQTLDDLAGISDLPVTTPNGL